MPFLIHSHMPRHACGFKLASDGHDTRALQRCATPRWRQTASRTFGETNEACESDQPYDAWGQCARGGSVIYTVQINCGSLLCPMSPDDATRCLLSAGPAPPLGLHHRTCHIAERCTEIDFDCRAGCRCYRRDRCRNYSQRRRDLRNDGACEDVASRARTNAINSRPVGSASRSVQADGLFDACVALLRQITRARSLYGRCSIAEPVR
jgi:hypothetical protein